MYSSIYHISGQYVDIKRDKIFKPRLSSNSEAYASELLETMKNLVSVVEKHYNMDVSITIPRPERVNECNTSSPSFTKIT